MDAGCQRGRIVIAGCGQNAAVMQTLTMQLFEMATVVREDNTTERVSASQDVGIGS